jgi:biotin-dependent carboxylase-like uncharacterized protein
MASLRVISPGILTTVQDLGRWGSQRLGISVAGPMDPSAHRAANALVGNDPDAATLEITLVGPTLEFDEDRVAAVAGADFELTVDERPQPTAASFQISSGGVLRFGARRKGARAYLAIDGGIVVPSVFGSRATHLPSRMGGLEGRALRVGDRVPVGYAHGRIKSGRRPTPSRFMPAVGSAMLRVLSGPHLDRFTAEALEVLQSSTYVVDVDSNRMGYRLRGPALRHAQHAEMLSDATALGMLQVPAGGAPILLMADRQTTGGYPGIATVITADIGLAGQLAPGDAMTLHVVTKREAVKALAEREQLLGGLEAEARR